MSEISGEPKATSKSQPEGEQATEDRPIPAESAPSRRDVNRAERPWNPYLVLVAAVLLPGVGHVLLGVPQRGLSFVFFIVIFGWVGSNLMPAHASFAGQYIGAIFVYGLSVIDAYKQARVRWETRAP
jgi:hypothetical protein